MAEVVCKERTFSATSFSDLNNKKYLKVLTCPYCVIGTDANRSDLKAFKVDDGIIADATYKCTSCDKVFHVSYVKLNDEELFKPFSVYPNF